ncbi:MAG TPA: hypothetical protein DCM40_29320, partial [Maribacter sp.]|nr:hypothetical protein [Maribacter sp.]
YTVSCEDCCEYETYDPPTYGPEISDNNEVQTSFVSGIIAAPAGISIRTTLQIPYDLWFSPTFEYDAVDVNLIEITWPVCMGQTKFGTCNEYPIDNVRTAINNPSYTNRIQNISLDNYKIYMTNPAAHAAINLGETDPTGFLVNVGCNSEGCSHFVLNQNIEDAGITVPVVGFTFNDST